MSREELRAALEELTASLAESGVEVPGEDAVLELDENAPSEDRAARLEVLEELRGL